ncbi:hypothetical protein EGW08_023292 [Elysia chlorotica]|uniref:SWIM-type domain-containing protein n=1 Tax=Elysia chlorotica TaxID=188477 RepID=A0A3S0Z1X1_ELYCH|nr:hypothetical protein EGW08_023292 [Elysia chlorotica]
MMRVFMAKEDKNIMEQCLRVFAQQFNPDDTQCFIVDKDMSAIGAVFPGVPINLCQFHISQAVERYLRKELGRGTSVLQVVLDSFMKQVNTESEEEFVQLKRDISSIVPQPVVDYFETNWWSKRHLWAACCNIFALRFHANTTNAIESSHSKIKKTINEKLSLSNVLAALVNFNDEKISDQCRKNLITSNSLCVDHRDRDETSLLITKSLTRFSGQVVKQELSLSDIGYTVVESDSGDRIHCTTTTSCTCSTFGHFRVPCRHIFVTRRYAGLPLFQKNLVPDRFKRSRVPLPATFSLPNSDLPVRTIHSVSFSLRSVEDRYKRAKTVCDRIASQFILGAAEFQDRLQQLEDFIGTWSELSTSSVSPSPVPVIEPQLVCTIDLDSNVINYPSTTSDPQLVSATPVASADIGTFHVEDEILPCPHFLFLFLRCLYTPITPKSHRQVLPSRFPQVQVEAEIHPCLVATQRPISATPVLRADVISAFHFEDEILPCPVSPPPVSISHVSV